MGLYAALGGGNGGGFEVVMEHMGVESDLVIKIIMFIRYDFACRAMRWLDKSTR